MSTIEVENIAASNEAKEALWLSRVAVTFRKFDPCLIPIFLSDS